MKNVIRLLSLFLSFYLCEVHSGQCQNRNVSPTTRSFIPGIDSTQTDAGLKFNPSDNFYSITPLSSYSKSIASSTVPKQNQDNPDFGFMPYGSDIENAYEEIQKRSTDERFFRSQADASIIYFQKSSVPFNYFKNGKWLSIDSRLKKIDDKHYAASQQPLVCALDIDKKKTIMDDGKKKFGFNHFSMLEYDMSGNTTSYAANWQNYTVGDNGIYIKSVFPGIDMIIKFTEHTIKSNFILLHSRSGSSRIVFIDSLDLPDGYKVTGNLSELNKRGYSGDLNINNNEGKSQYIYGQINISDNAHDKLQLQGYYTFSGSAVNINVYDDVFNNAGITYPLTIDPIVNYGPFNAAANTIGAGTSPAFCSTTIVAAIPGGTTCTDFSANWSVTNTSNACGCPGAQNCNLAKDRLYITSSCGGATPVGSPGVLWSCPGCNFLGTWNPTLPFGSNGSTSMATCIAPSCNSQNITFTLFLLQGGCNGGASCGSCTYGTNTCAHLNSWSVTIQAHSLEVLGNITGSGSATVTGSCNINSTLDPAALYGVPGYTYSWNPGGAATSTLVVNQGTNGSYTYIATITDACGTAQTATFTFNIADCPLPIELLYFDAVYNGKSVDTKWSTASETNNDYFTVERSTDGINYSIINTVKSNAQGGNSTTQLNYTLNDATVKTGTYYYRLKQTDLNGIYNYSNIVPVTITNETDVFNVVPNPATNSVDIMYVVYDDVPSLLKILDDQGKLVYSEQIQNIRGKRKHTINLSNYSNGLYFIRLTTTAKTYSVKLMKQ